MSTDQGNAIMHEIYASLVCHATLVAEVRLMEDKQQQIMLHSTDQVTQSLQATEEALRVASRERQLRMQQASSLRNLQAAKFTETQSIQAQQSKQLEELSRELSAARSRLLAAHERQAASAQGLRTERQQARQRHRAATAHRLRNLLAQFEGHSLHMAFLTWRNTARLEGC